jgi:ParB family chromosome partitioning protein
MKTPTLMTIRDVAVAEVEAAGRLRPVTEAGVESLIASIGEVGVLKDAIHVRRRKDGRLQLIAGAHRLEAARRLGWERIEAKVWTDVTDDWARLMEIDDNLAGAELNPLDAAVFLAARKAVYERIHPETKAATGAALVSKRWNTADTMSVVSFAASTAEKFGLSDRHVRRMIAAGSRLGPDEVARLRGAPRAVSLRDLSDIGRIGDAAERYDVVAALAEGRAKSAGEARRRRALAAAGAPPPRDPAERAFLRLLDAWTRAPRSARRQFLGEAGHEVIALLNVPRSGLEAAE